MAIVIPSSDVQHTNLNNAITSLTSQITSAGSNGQLVEKLTCDKIQAQHNLLMSLLGSGHVSAATILAGSAATYLTGNTLSIS